MVSPTYLHYRLIFVLCLNDNCYDDLLILLVTILIFLASNNIVGDETIEEMSALFNYITTAYFKIPNSIYILTSKQRLNLEGSVGLGLDLDLEL